MIVLCKYLAAFSIATSAIAYAQNSPQTCCCDNGFAQTLGTQADASITSVKDINNNCGTEILVTCRQCVDRTRDHLICNGAGGSKYCHESSSSDYPRYYALWHPITVSNSSLTFNAQYGGGNPSPQTFSITNGVWQAFQIDNTLNWSASKTRNWLTLSPSSGTVSGTTHVFVMASINIGGLAVGTYSDVIAVSATQVSNRQWETITVTLTITNPLSVSIAGPGYLSCNQAGTWTASTSGGTPPYHYAWYYYIPCNGAAPASSENIQPLLPPCGSWFQAGSDSPTFSHSACSDFEVKCVVTDAGNKSVTSNIIYVTVSGFAKVATGNSSADDIIVTIISEDNSLSQNYPNPFNPSTKIRFSLREPSHVKLVVYDMLGREVARLADEEMDAGYRSVTWNASNVSSGIYIYQLSIGNLIQVRRMILMK
jgi:hypothetical protein